MHETSTTIEHSQDCPFLVNKGYGCWCWHLDEAPEEEQHLETYDTFSPGDKLRKTP